MPAVHLARYGEGVNKNKTFADIYRWSASTVVEILKKREYLGPVSYTHLLPAKTMRAAHLMRVHEKGAVKCYGFTKVNPALTVWD